VATYTVDFAGMTQDEAKRMVSSMSGPIKTTGQQTYDRMLKSGYWKKPVTPAASPAPATSPAATPGASAADLAKLKANQDAYVEAQSANIDVDAQRGFQQGMSNLIGSGLAGTTVVGGMQAGVTEQATRAKADVAAGAQRTTDQLTFNYANLAQQAAESQANRGMQTAESQANRDLQLQLGQMGQNTALSQSAMSQPTIQQADTSGLENLIQRLQKQIEDMQGQMSTLQQKPANPNSLVGKEATQLS